MSRTEFTSEEFAALGEGTLWPRFLLFPAMALLGYVGFVMGLGGDSLAVKLAWSMFVGYCWFCVGGSFHETVHQTMGRWKDANIWYGRIIGTLLGIPYSVYREVHIRHHAYLNTSKDFELWPYSKPGKALWFRRLFVVFDIVGAVFANPVVYGRIYFKRNSPLSPQARATITREYIGMAVFWIGGGILIAALSYSGTVDLSKFDLMWLLPLQIAAMLNGFRKFTEHLGMPSTDPILGTRTVIGNNWVTRLCSYFNFELFVHGPHHRFPKAPHFELETRLAEFQQKHPNAVVPLFSSYLAAVWDMLPCLWKNPGVGFNAGGEDRYQMPPGQENFVSEIGATSADSGDRKVA